MILHDIIETTAQLLPTPQNQIPPHQKHVIRQLFLLLEFMFTLAVLPYKNHVGCKEYFNEKLESVEVELMTWRNLIGTLELHTTCNNDGTIRTIWYPQNITGSWIEYVGELLREKLRVDGRHCSVGEAAYKNTLTVEQFYNS